mmetsp:Transcript_46934/g.107829  ORF Transcript_46934/g.107829 Transcript_46934/m.107829 type:complete len:280 (+) Transcript_46934:3-842(+)
MRQCCLQETTNLCSLCSRLAAPSSWCSTSKEACQSCAGPTSAGLLCNLTRPTSQSSASTAARFVASELAPCPVATAHHALHLDCREWCKSNQASSHCIKCECRTCAWCNRSDLLLFVPPPLLPPPPPPLPPIPSSPPPPISPVHPSPHPMLPPQPTSPVRLQPPTVPATGFESFVEASKVLGLGESVRSVPSHDYQTSLTPDPRTIASANMSQQHAGIIVCLVATLACMFGCARSFVSMVSLTKENASSSGRRFDSRSSKKDAEGARSLIANDDVSDED